MAKRASITSISDSKATTWAKEAGERQALYCKQIPGLHLAKLKSGAVWRYRYTDAWGKRRTKTLGHFTGKGDKNLKPEDAAAIAYEWRQADADPLRDKELVRDVRRQEAASAELRKLGHYLETRYKPLMDKTWQPTPAKVNYSRIKGHFSDLLDRDMATINKNHILAWQAHCEAPKKKGGRGLRYKTIERTYSSLKTLLRQAVKDEVLEADPLENFTLETASIDEQERINADPKKAERRMLTADEIAGISEGLEAFAEELRAERRNSRQHGKAYLPDLDDRTMPHWFIPFCQLAMRTGLRPGDLYSLTWDELNIKFGRLTKVTEKSKHMRRKKREPIVVDLRLNDGALAVMKTWWKEQGKPEGGLVFPSPRTGAELDRKAHTKPWARVKRLGGLPDNLNFYAFRHHFVSAMIKANVPILTVAKMVGQKDATMIQEYYGHLCEDQALEALDIVAATLEGKNRQGMAEDMA
ncbi:tyrosine-type recombinase/integrase [uncultured Alcanivorax sp.]|uniref:tyrosine-type recombinase/integrase n=1 Tax=uncultured Alcanivorax sp. TaxID=191215 RepID=UPI0025EFA048|nr:tyrosine-type recombinase/integrase [uncultured Alcanivorax sp.]